MAEDRTGVDKVTDMIKDIKTCVLTTVGEDGRLVSRPTVVQQVRFDGDLWFVTDGDSRKVAQIRHGAQVNAAFSARDAWVCLAGTAEITYDDAKADELWNPSLDAWFTQGPHTPDLALIKVHAESAEYWDIPGGGAVTGLIAPAASKVTGRRPDIGENETVELGSATPSAH